MMKNKVETILIILCIIFFNLVNITCAFKDPGNTKPEMIVIAKISPAIQVPYWTLYRFFQEKPAGMIRKILSFTNSSL